MKRALIIAAVIAAALLSFPIRDAFEHWGERSDTTNDTVQWVQKLIKPTQEHAGGYYDCAGVANSKDCELKPTRDDDDDAAAESRRQKCEAAGFSGCGE